LYVDAVVVLMLLLLLQLILSHFSQNVVSPYIVYHTPVVADVLVVSVFLITISQFDQNFLFICSLLKLMVTRIYGKFIIKL